MYFGDPISGVGQPVQVSPAPGPVAPLEDPRRVSALQNGLLEELDRMHRVAAGLLNQIGEWKLGVHRTVWRSGEAVSRETANYAAMLNGIANRYSQILAYHSKPIPQPQRIERGVPFGKRLA